MARSRRLGFSYALAALAVLVSWLRARSSFGFLIRWLARSMGSWSWARSTSGFLLRGSLSALVFSSSGSLDCGFLGRLGSLAPWGFFSCEGSLSRCGFLYSIGSLAFCPLGFSDFDGSLSP